ncbi:MAG: squalene/phytoene synthase family protein [Burkholderiales bacterium]|nr:squalene/phytoene synthase family protein [Burkholderiales bacterium]
MRAVSRSFYLSIRLLPAPLREPVSLAYLLARATDTVADTADLPAPERLDKLRRLAAAIEGDAAARAAAVRALASFVPMQHDPGEQALIQALPQCLAWLDELQPADRDDVRSVLRTITRGQLLDVERFPDASGTRALATAAELREYTWLVAGCVGEFWTHLCFRHLPAFAALPRGAMLGLGRRYGMGLQLVNILRDAGSDLAQGRCYFPACELALAGLSPQQAAANPSLLAPVTQPWHEEAARLLDSGMEYALAVRSRRVRAASALPALVGVRTLALVKPGQPAPAKVPRGEIRVIMAVLALTLSARAPMRTLYASPRG